MPQLKESIDVVPGAEREVGGAARPRTTTVKWARPQPETLLRVVVRLGGRSDRARSPHPWLPMSLTRF